ncbi:MAG: peptidase S41 [Bacteroidetes bacterium]|nr:peptidase S41 [Bacteroidota bacterium]
MRNLLTIACLLLVLFAHTQSLNTISAADKVYGLSKCWQEVNYNFVYFNKINRAAWDSLYKTLIPQVQQTANDYDYYRLLQKFYAFLHDGHTNVYLPPSVNNLQLGKMFGDYWFGTENIDGKAIITRTLRTRIKEIPIGSEVIEVNGLPTARYIADSIKPYIASSTDYVLEDEAYANLLRGMTGSTYNIKIKRPDGSVLPLSLVHERSKDTSYFPPFKTQGLLELRWYDKDIAYLALNSFGDQKIDKIFMDSLPALLKAKALILDLRGNGGGSTGIGTFILQHLTNDSILPRSRTFTRQHVAVYKAWGSFLKPADTLFGNQSKERWRYAHDSMYLAFDYSADTFHRPAQRLVVPTAVLIGHNTASAAEDFLIAASEQKHFTLIGERSFGSTGQPYSFSLPGGGGARVCTKKDTWPDGHEFVGYGIAPAIYVRPVLKDFLNNTDPVLDKALAHLQQKLKNGK